MAHQKRSCLFFKLSGSQRLCMAAAILDYDMKPIFFQVELFFHRCSHKPIRKLLFMYLSFEAYKVFMKMAVVAIFNLDLATQFAKGTFLMSICSATPKWRSVPHLFFKRDNKRHSVYEIISTSYIYKPKVKINVTGFFCLFC